MSVTAEEFEAEMNQLAGHLMDGTSEFLRDQIPLIVSNVKENFDNASTAGNVPWAPHAPATIRRHGRHPLLILSGTMKGAALGTSDAYHMERIVEGPDQAELNYGITGLPYAGVHQDGSERIPQREYLAVNEGTVDAIVEAAADFFQSKFEEK